MTPAELGSFMLKSLFRALVVGAILYYGISQMPKKKAAIHIFFIIGIILSMIADTMYYWPILGAIVGNFAMLGVYFFYAIGFLTRMKAKIWSIVLLIPISYLAYFFTTRVLVEPLEKSKIGFYIFYILIHLLFAVTFCWAAVVTKEPLIILGAVSFMGMDIIKSVNSFVHPISFSIALTLLPYLLGHFLIAKSMGTFKRKKPIKAP